MEASTASMLVGEEAGEVLRTALATRGEELLEWQRVAIHARPGAETSVGYDVRTTTGRVYLVASTARLSHEQESASQAVRLESEVGAVHVWMHPADPLLVALPTACDPAAASAALSRARGSEVAIERLEVLVLRPLRRAVLRAEAIEDGHRRVLYLKVVRPERAHGLLKRHRVCGLAPEALDLGNGLVAVAEARGVPMTVALHRPHGGAAARPAPSLVQAALDSLPVEAIGLRRRASVSDRLASYADALSARVVEPERVRVLTGRLSSVLASCAPSEDVPTHGDLHPANVFLDSAERPTRVTALIDLDTLGPGRRCDDYAALVAHLLVLPSLDPVGYGGAPSVAEEHFRYFAERASERELRARVGAHLVALASGADGATVEQWLSVAEEVWRGTLLR